MNPRELDNLLDHLTQPDPATTPAADEDKPDDEEYGQPVSFHGAAPVGLLGRIAQRLRARLPRA